MYTRNQEVRFQSYREVICYLIPKSCCQLNSCMQVYERTKGKWPAGKWNGQFALLLPRKFGDLSGKDFLNDSCSYCQNVIHPANHVIIHAYLLKYI